MTTWREWLTIIEDTGEIATVADPNGDSFRVRSAALDEEIRHMDDSAEAVAEYDAWCNGASMRYDR